MTTTVVKTIGATGDYSTLQAWEDACPANLVTLDQIYQGQCQNQEFSGTGAMLVIGGATTDATRYIELTTVSGASFSDNASKLTNALRYNAANGAAIKTTGAWNKTIDIVGTINVKISKLQIAQTKSGSGATVTLNTPSAGVVEIDRCIIEGYLTNGQGVLNTVGPHKIKNSLVVQLATSGVAKIATLGQGCFAYNSTFVSIGATATVGLTGNYGTTTIHNCYVGGVTSIVSGSTSWAVTTSYASVSGWTGVIPLSTATFQNVTSGTHDFRTLSGSALIDAGTTDATNAPTDIVGTTRSGTWDVGVWEFASSASNGTASGTPDTLDLIAPSASAVGTGGAGAIVTPVLKNNTGTALASISGWTVNVYNQSTGALVVQKTGLATNSSGILTITDAAIVSGTSYTYEPVHATYGRRLPTGAAS